MTANQATEISNYLIDELNSSGFGSIVNEINDRLTEDIEEKEFQREPRSILIFFLRESIEILESVSNEKYNALLEKFNDNLTQGKIEKIQVELISRENESFFDLKDLPDYSKISTAFREILNTINNSN